MKKIVFYTCFSIYFIAFLSAQEVRYGLVFQSHEVEAEKRTGLDLTPKNPFSFPDGFSLSFDALFKIINSSKETGQKLLDPIYGYILRMEGDNNQNIDLILKPEFEKSFTSIASVLPKIIVTCSDSEFIANYKFSEHNNNFDEWIHIVITVETDKSLLTVMIGNEKYTSKIDNIRDFKKVRIVFGKNNYPKTLNTDVPPMIVKDITISNLKQQPLYHWALSKHTAEGVYDELKQHFAACSEPVWILDKHANWEKLLTITTKGNSQICYNEKENTIAIADKDNFFTYNTIRKTLQKDSTDDEKPLSHFINQLIFNPFTNKYYFYSFEKNTAFYDSVKKRWSNNRTDVWINHWHHNRYIYTGDSCLYTFFGYGHHLYNNEILKYDFKTDSMVKTAFNGDQILPRYLGGLGKIDDHRIIVFGGYGSESGNQELSPKNYYDAYTIDLKAKTIKKLWELNNPDYTFVVANSLVVDTIHRCFYALTFPQQKYKSRCLLYKFSIDKPECKILADSIPFTFQDIYSYADLFLNTQSNELFAVISSPLVPDSSSVLSVYSLAFPPLAQTDLYQKETAQKSDYRTILFIILGGGLLLAALMYIYYRKKKIRKDKTAEVRKIGIVDSGSGVAPEFEPLGGIKPITTRTEKQSIFLFGGFQVMDKEGRNITGEFTPLLKQLFLIILLNTLKDGKGISSFKLRETMWFDKNDENAKNNRRVSLSKLRQIFKQMGAIDIKNLNTNWIIEFDKDIYCDYYEAMILMNRLKEKSARTSKDIKRLLSIVSAGELLPNLQVEWADSFKADFANNLIDLFLNIVKQTGPDISDQDRINLIDAILIHDFLNEDAIKIKCTLLTNMGKNGLAKKVYDSFIKEYRLLFGVDYKQSFEQIISPVK